ncbi:16S rRNA (uracil(1498)-N(3))-methyltransferase [Candidatus Gracilibacteria bacterium]|nr:16S rRNA (uracil(1498)-N(3))-methyltransferase [Candidatus Gracilibacteria bacterium]
MQRFFVTFPLSIDINLTDPMIYSQMVRVLRVKIGEHVILFDGDGTETEYEIQTIEKKGIHLTGVGQREPHTEQKKKISLYQGMPNKYEKIEYILQKGVEVGIQKFIFFRSDRSQKLLLSSAKLDRFKSIAREALEQCGGCIMPEIEFLDRMPICQSPDHNIVLDTTGKLCTMHEFTELQNIHLWVGPEGGWSDGEREIMVGYGFIFARFGERILRTETAGIVTSFALFFV